jgi:ADP-ribosylglycohydrolase
MAMINRIKGMLLLSAYGDALAAPTEPMSLEGKVFEPISYGRLKLVDEYFNKNEHPGAWGIWPKLSEVSGLRGIPTDDTSYKFLVLYPWIKQSIQLNITLDEIQFRKWLEGLKKYPNGLFLDGISDSHFNIKHDFLKMFKAAEEMRPELFFHTNVPIFFGSFMYLSLVPAKINLSPEETLLEFIDFSILDQGIGKCVTALMTSILNSCLKKNGLTEKNLYGFLKDTLNHLIVHGENNGVKNMSKLNKVAQESTLMGETYRGKSSFSLVKELAKIYKRHRDSGGSMFDSVFMWRQLWTSLSYSYDNPILAMSIVAAGPGDSDTVCSFLGSIIGASLGEEEINKMKLNGVSLSKEFIIIKRNIRLLYMTSIEEAAESLLFERPPFIV